MEEVAQPGVRIGNRVGITSAQAKDDPYFASLIEAFPELFEHEFERDVWLLKEKDDDEDE